MVFFFLTMAFAMPLFSASASFGKAEILCEIFPESRRIAVEATVHMFEKAEFRYTFWVEPHIERITVRDGDGKNLPFTYDAASGVVRLGTLPQGNHTLYFNYSGVYPEKVIPTSGSVITNDFFQILYRWHPIPRGERFDGELTIITPEDMRSTSCGTMVGEKIERGKRTRYFRTQTPLSRSFSLVGGKYREIVENLDDVRIRVLVNETLTFPQDAFMDYFKKTLRGCIDLFGFYPFSEMQVVQLPLAPNGGGWGGTPTISYLLGDESWKSPPLESMYPNFFAHEIVHQYFGCIAEYGDDDRGMYISEGVTEFSSALIVDSFAPSAFDTRAGFWLDDLKRIPPAQSISMASATYDDRRVFFAFAYDKFPLFLKALREKIGDARLRSIIRHFLNKFYLKDAYEFQDFLKQIEEETAHDPETGKLVNSWIFQPGLSASESAGLLNLSVVLAEPTIAPRRAHPWACLTPEFLRDHRRNSPAKIRN